MTISVIGAGSWGCALSQVLADKGRSVSLWARRGEVASEINDNHTNKTYLPDVNLNKNIRSYSSYHDALFNSDAIIIVTPSSYVRSTVESIKQYVDATTPILICSKGVESDTGLLMSEIVEDVVGNVDRIAVLSGPTHAEEVVKGQPSGVVIASPNSDTAKYFADLFKTQTFRTYVSDDIVGVELCAAFKNVIAIAVGISYGMEFGDNTAAMLITRGLAEMSRMVCALGGDAITCMGLAGAGDMVVTAMSQHSRNRRFGQYYVAKDKTLDDFTRDTHMVVEGAFACKTLNILADEHGVELPITDAVNQIVWHDAKLTELADALISRPSKPEFYGI